jgi:hypothetical protein
MASLSKIIAQVRVLLNNPLAQHPSPLHLITLAQHHVQDYHNQLQNTSQPWHLGSWPITVNSGTDEYLITAPNFGKPRYILTEDVSLPGFTPWEVPILLPENFDQFARSPFPGGILPGKHNAQAMAFYGTYGGFRMVKVGPMPQQSADYRIWYDVGEYSPGGLGDELTIPEQHHVLVNRIALSALPYCKWGDERQATRADARALQESLTVDSNRYEDTFSRYITNMRAEQTRSKVLWGASELEGW